MFQDILQKITAHVDEVVGCLLLDRDAVIVAAVYPEGPNEQVAELAVEMSSLIGSMLRRGGLNAASGLREFSLQTEDLQAICHRVADDYMLVLALDATGDSSQGQTMLRMVAPWVERIL